MPSSSFTLDTIGAELQRTIRRLGKATERGMFRAATGAHRRAVQAVGEVASSGISEAKTNPIDTGRLRRSYKVIKVRGGAVLENVAPYAAAQEFGTRPFTPPMGPLLAWAIRKGRGKRTRKTSASSRAKAGNRTERKRRPKARRPKAAKPPTPSQISVARELAGRAWQSIRTRGVIPKRFHELASRDFEAITEKALLAELRKVDR